MHTHVFESALIVIVNMHVPSHPPSLLFVCRKLHHQLTTLHQDPRRCTEGSWAKENHTLFYKCMHNLIWFIENAFELYTSCLPCGPLWTLITSPVHPEFDWSFWSDMDGAEQLGKPRLSAIGLEECTRSDPLLGARWSAVLETYCWHHRASSEGRQDIDSVEVRSLRGNGKIPRYKCAHQ